MKQFIGFKVYIINYCMVLKYKIENAINGSITRMRLIDRKFFNRFPRCNYQAI